VSRPLPLPSQLGWTKSLSHACKLYLKFCSYVYFVSIALLTLSKPQPRTHFPGLFLGFPTFMTFPLSNAQVGAHREIHQLNVLLLLPGIGTTKIYSKNLGSREWQLYKASKLPLALYDLDLWPPQLTVPCPWPLTPTVDRFMSLTSDPTVDRFMTLTSDPHSWLFHVLDLWPPQLTVSWPWPLTPTVDRFMLLPCGRFVLICIEIS